jgi:predicted metal-binding membrane protein
MFVGLLIAAAWWLSLSRMSGAMMGPGDLGPFPAFALTWTAMMAAMMLPSVLPSLAVGGPAPGRSLGVAARSVTAITIYIAAWTMVGIGAFCVIAAVRMMDVGVLAWSRGGPYIAGAAILGAAVYEVTPLKRACLLRCRASVGMVRDGPVASLAYSVNCTAVPASWSRCLRWGS